MIKLAHFTETNQATLVQFMQNNAFAIVTAMGHPYPVATHIPLEVIQQTDGSILLTGHIMRKTDHHRAFENNPHVLVIFNGPHTYISSSWYNNLVTASTWNYMTVHARGIIHFLDEAATLEAVKAITEKYEGHHNKASFQHIPQQDVQAMLKGIVAFEIKVEALSNVFKLSQNRDETSQLKIIEALNKRGDENSRLIATEMSNRLNKTC
jgi:transcriptional regulator